MDANPSDPAQDPEHLFDAGRVLSPNGPHGVVVRAAVCESLRARLDVSSVAVKIVPIGDGLTSTLRSTVSALRSSARHAALVQYHGVWAAPRGEAWIVSELCEGGSVGDVLGMVRVREVAVLEAIVAYVVRNVLLVLDSLHAMGEVHGDVRVGNFLLDARGRVKLADWGVFHVLEKAMRLRVAYPGARLWPAPEIGSVVAGVDSPDGAALKRRYDASAEIWAVGIALMEMVEGRASVLRSYNRAVGMHGTGGAVPGLREPSRWSLQLNAFVASACTLVPEARPSAGQLLKSDFLKLADGGALAAVVEQAVMMPTPPSLQNLYDRADVVSMLHRRNNCVRAPLIDLDALDALDFVDPEPRTRGIGEDKPAVEVSLRTALENRRRAWEVGRGGGQKVGFSRAGSSLGLTDGIAVFVDTIDMATRRGR